jgi:hypothetical protein
MQSTMQRYCFFLNNKDWAIKNVGMILQMAQAASVSYIAERSIVRPLWGLTAEGIVPSAISLPNLAQARLRPYLIPFSFCSSVPSVFKKVLLFRPFSFIVLPWFSPLLTLLWVDRFFVKHLP